MAKKKKVTTTEEPKFAVITEQQYAWKAIYKDCTNLCEFNEDGSRNEFKDIDKSRLSQFILFGNHFRIWFSAYTGEIYFNHEKVQQLNEYYNLPVNYAEGLIQYKNGNQFIINKAVDLGDGKAREFGYTVDNIVHAHCMGYKFHNEGKKVQILIKVTPDDPETKYPQDVKVDIILSVTDLETQETKETVYAVVK